MKPWIGAVTLAFGFVGGAACSTSVHAGRPSCTGGRVAASFDSFDVASGTGITIIKLTVRQSAACQVESFPRVTLLDGHRKALAEVPNTASADVALVTVEPGRGAIVVFEQIRGNSGGPCPDNQIEITAAGMRIAFAAGGSVVVANVPTNGPLIDACEGGVSQQAVLGLPRPRP